ncbi:hypothetical protein [Klenkia sp. PcliD-1-E]|uniref:hypothetical protein n=1 Tax=Klenkia sp. PcliD-1-E TaxID=2954492 RepID=UPI00209697D2|nr:hypothetical protein [Klenkia sp. PcliD-1-E]MCO7220465.1 hypothetical protein [Klenkia sp. PcliD-1-E]
MELAVADLPALDVLRGRWAATAAVVAALGYPDAAHARDAGSWRWDDGGGTWAEVAVLDADRAVLLGRDRTARGSLSRRPDGEPTGELLTGAPGWWAQPLRGRTEEITFVLGWSAGRWERVPSDLHPGPGAGGLAGLPVDAEQLYGVVDSYVEGVSDDQGLGDWRTPWPAVAALGQAGPDLTVQQLADVLGPLRADLPAGVLAARRFSPAAG